MLPLPLLPLRKSAVGDRNPDPVYPVLVWSPNLMPVNASVDPSLDLFPSEM